MNTTANRFRWAAVLAGMTMLLTANITGAAEFDPKLAPSKAEWQHFHRMSEAELVKLWSFQTARGHKRLPDWAWQWRMGWIQRCGSGNMNSICPRILTEGLRDNAMVIRAEAATRIGRRFENKANPDVIKALEAAYLDPRNSRNGNPLFVYERILEALDKLHDPRAAKAAERLAASHPESKAYWAKLKNSSRVLKK